MTKRERILYLEPSALVSGGGVALLRLVQSLNRHRFSPIVILGSEGPLEKAFKRIPGVRVLVRPFPIGIASITRFRVFSGGLAHLPDLVRYAIGIRAIARRLRPAITHSNGLKTHVVSALIERKARGALVWHIRDYLGTSYMPATSAGLVRFLARHVPDLLICNSDATRVALLHGEAALTGIGSGVVFSQRVDAAKALRVYDGIALAHAGTGPSAVVVPSGVALCRDRDDDGSAVTKAQGERGGLRVTMLGRVAHWKGQHVFIAAAERLRRAHPGVRFVVAGGATTAEDEKYLAGLQEQVRLLGAGGQIVLAGWVRNVPKLLASTDVLVHASLSPEPFGQVIVEGMAVEVPVVATGMGGPIEIITNGVDGMLYTPGDAAELAARVDTLLRDRERRVEMGKAGRQTVARRFSMKIVAAQVMELYTRISAHSRGAK